MTRCSVRGMNAKVVMAALGLWLGSASVCSGQSARYAEQLADAIKLAENSRSHPYGVMVRGVRLSESAARQRCLAIIIQRWQSWDGRGDFIVWLGERYAPSRVRCANDPARLNRNWVRNVRSLIGRR